MKDLPSRECVLYLIKKHKTISVMESCTGGLIASMITDVPGASEIFFGSSVAYSNEEKIRLGVPAKVIETCGVYSGECAIAMAKAQKALMKTDVAIGITGSTGNIDPNNPDSVTGEGYACILVDEDVFSYRIHLDIEGKSRSEIKQDYAAFIFDRLMHDLNPDGAQT